MYCTDVLFQVLLTFIWLRRYPTMHHLSMHFDIPVTCVHRILHKIIPILHAIYVPKYICWHSHAKWRQLVGYFPFWPRVVAILDGTPFKISRPKGIFQRLFWRKDWHCFFLNWMVIMDVEGFIVYSRPGFVGHLNDATCFR